MRQGLPGSCRVLRLGPTKEVTVAEGHPTLALRRSPRQVSQMSLF